MKVDLTVAGYIFNDNKLLLIHHNKLNRWLPVGGHIEKDEVPDDALRREIKEETNLDIEILNSTGIKEVGSTKRNLKTPFYVNVHSVGDHDHCCFFYICKALNSEDLKINNELRNYKWFSEADLSDDYISPDVKEIATEAFKLIKNPAS